MKHVWKFFTFSLFTKPANMSWSAKSRIAGIFTLWISAQSEVRGLKAEDHRELWWWLRSLLNVKIRRVKKKNVNLELWKWIGASPKYPRREGNVKITKSWQCENPCYPGFRGSRHVCRLGKEWKCENFSNMFHTGSLIFFAVKNVKYFTFSHFHIFTLFPLFKNWYVLEISHFEAA